MAFNEKLAERMRRLMAERDGVVEKRMFGGVAFMLNGNLCCGVHKEALMLRMTPEAAAAALRQPHTRIFDLTRRPMKGWVLVDPEGIKTAAKLKKWMDQSLAFAASLPAK